MCCGSWEDESEMDFCQVTMRRNALCHCISGTLLEVAYRSRPRQDWEWGEVKTEQSWDEKKSLSWCCGLFRNWESSSAQPVTAARTERCPWTWGALKLLPKKKKSNRDPREAERLGRSATAGKEKCRLRKILTKLFKNWQDRVSLLIWSLSFLSLSCSVCVGDRDKDNIQRLLSSSPQTLQSRLVWRCLIPTEMEEKK